MKECPVEQYQNPEEFERLLEVVAAIKPRRVLEIGSLFGGSLWSWMSLADPGAHFVTVDKLVPGNDPRYVAQKAGHDEIWQVWAHEKGHRLDIIEGDSTDEIVARHVRKVIPVVDFLFIDGDHTLKAVQDDYDNYSILVRDGGLIAFHDIVHPGCGVQLVWEEIKKESESEGLAWFEFIEKVGDRGIGVLQC